MTIEEPEKKVYFFSDIHLGLPNHEKSLQREKLLVKCLTEIEHNAKCIYFVGDIFDFWWEYKSVVPRGFVRFLGKIAELSDKGIEIHFFTGNHDVWLKDYLVIELGIELHFHEFETNINEKSFLIAHGDGLGPGDKSYKILKKLFTNKFLQWCYSRLHPNFAFGIGYRWSQNRRKKEKIYSFAGEDKELLIQYSKEKLNIKHFDFFVYGHRHIPLIFKLNNNSNMINIGDWIVNFTFAIFDSQTVELKSYKNGFIENFETDLEKLYKMNLFD